MTSMFGIFCSPLLSGSQLLGSQRMAEIRVAGAAEGYRGPSLDDYVRITAQSEQFRNIGSNLGLVGDELAGYVKHRECNLAWRQHREAHGLLHHGIFKAEFAKFEALTKVKSLEKLRAEWDFERHGPAWPFGVTRGYSSAQSNYIGQLLYGAAIIAVDKGK